MKIVDAGVLVELLVGELDPGMLGHEELAAPHSVDSEVTQVLRGLVRRGVISADQGDLAMNGFMRLTLTRFPADWLRPRMWELRDNLSAYDATYVALAESADATALLTTDARLANAPGPRCRIELL
ncbi:type II toxin-antitoxin system VapC family toxin [[Mycobacterium] zoologicum]|uniref:type II toxin-antitoxin system VapC family toxin n=1 Tax=[Mycobacterium] zoologicum TaxID=2872311 RepID=UPI001CDB1ADF|nr:type II toxin-antitoxin system VapC family toxin [Mycolicibacter sp. MYC101]MEB3065469.1 type II toxin-antitoxin system VapC family toxin [Mycolicibacter sp. MYC101]